MEVGGRKKKKENEGLSLIAVDKEVILIGRQ